MKSPSLREGLRKPILNTNMDHLTNTYIASIFEEILELKKITSTALFAFENFTENGRIAKKYI